MDLLINELQKDSVSICIRTLKTNNRWSLNEYVWANKKLGIDAMCKINKVINSNDVKAHDDTKASISNYIHSQNIWSLLFEIECLTTKGEYALRIYHHRFVKDRPIVENINIKLKKNKIVVGQKKLLEVFGGHLTLTIVQTLFQVATILHDEYKNIKVWRFYYTKQCEAKISKEASIVLITSNQIDVDRLFVYSLLLSNDLSLLLYNQSLQESLKSAVSAIMTRNMSHNLGSHYLHYTKTQLEQLAKKGGEFGPDIRGAAKVMEYMQGRMDYLATLVSGDRFPYGCVNFKSQIYDVLTVDDFSKRHYDNKTEVKTGKLNRIRRVLKDAEKKNFGNEALENCLPDLSQLFSKAITNDAYNRTTNFLLTNLILSENFTRPNILEDTIEEDKGLKRINLQVLFKDKLFTGSSIIDIVKQEDDIKRKLSEINIAMPGGVMSCHAFFNIIENFIRNSAKYLQSDFSENNNLTITIKIAERIGENAETIGAKGEKLDVYEFTIFDNKHNANKVLANDSNTLLVSLRKKLEDLSILDSNNAVEKNNKGIKEMLFSAIWLRSYVYQNVTSENTPNSYEDVLLQIQSATTNSSRLDLIKDYGFSFLSVDDHGVENNTIASNLALRFTLPKFNTKTKLTLSGNDVGANLSKLLHIYGDVTCVDDEYSNHVKELNKGRADSGKNIYEEDLIIPRILKYEEGLTEIAALKKVLDARFGEEFDKYQISSGSSDDNLTSELENQYNIYFERHLSTKCDNMEDYKNFAYADSVSGGNYTITLSNIYNRWAKNGRKDDSEDYYEILKIKESALTRITLIDERLYNKMRNQKTETELACKNIRILNYNESNFSEDKIDNFIKLFTDDHKFNNGKDETHFLSIHLGIIEKIVKNADMFTLMKDKKGESISVDGRVKVFMRLLKEKFGPKVFISVHSGRGNFSAELEDSLDMYPFISMAALENVYENSKYLLSQLFYSTIYVGKGVANQHNPQY